MEISAGEKKRHIRQIRVVVFEGKILQQAVEYILEEPLTDENSDLVAGEEPAGADLISSPQPRNSAEADTR